MSKDKMFSIGEFSKKTGIPIPTLHYYDEIGLLQPKKNPSSGHRIYKYQDIITLQKILSLKFLGYSLDKIANLLHESSFSIDLNESLSLHLQILEREKEEIEQSMQAIKRVIKLVEEEGEVDSNVLFSLVYGMSTEHIHKDWMERHRLPNIMEELSKKSEEDKINLDKTLIQLSKKVKQLYGKPVENPKVQEMIKDYIEASISFLGEDLMQKLANTSVEELDIQELENRIPSPFTEDEQKWLNRAMEYYTEQVEME
ncbi:MerR family transcriptional regulator [Bacillus wiedmannii]|uniref:MerR family transcriptional regulator n=1 Tax=Bacillus wiedmannii TaxID=1890302 RepID=UPI000BF4D619|nr:MerR family transcriptional regulator [Bacillus wiedmannii]PEP22642.1 MerR family transcriptional regulator [Bacillus wiedmannii]PEP99451.1 MerR family transcriptional regulator [Bacillus wiedmannii]PFY73222.1 MerR family transcriptional regulator [Bacillus wiedmannii]PHF07545.1 MerR family transcriptional regulator [Bacillus wiedmannii]PHF96783.1 MerR family transcriptional regulator [Bacillus wiedmannii]